jgi:hypothetical protein
MLKRVSVGVLPLLFLAAAPRADAQAAPAMIVPGDEVRVLAPSVSPRTIQGQVLLYQGDSLAVEDAGGMRHAMHVDQIRRLSRNQGFDRRRSVRYGTLAGMFLGTSVGFVSGPLISMQRKDENFGATTAVSVGTGALLGAGLGALGGSVFAREHWQRFRMPVPHTTVSVGANGSLRLSIPVG